MLLHQLDALLTNLVVQSSGVPMHFIITTDAASWEAVHATVVTTIARRISARVIEGRTKEKAFPSIIVDLVDIASIVEGHREHLDSMKSLFTQIEHSLVLEPGDARRRFYRIPATMEGDAVEVQTESKVTHKNSQTTIFSISTTCSS